MTLKRLIGIGCVLIAIISYKRGQSSTIKYIREQKKLKSGNSCPERLEELEKNVRFYKGLAISSFILGILLTFSE